MATNQMLGGSAFGSIPTVLGSVGGGLSGPVAGSDTQIIYNRAGVAGATGLLTFEYTSGTLTTSALAISNNASFGGTTTLMSVNVTGTATFDTINIQRLNINTVSVSDVFTVTSGTYGTDWISNILGGRKYFTFYSNCTITVGASAAAIEYFAVGGGGGGGYVNSAASGGGGGAGGLQTNASSSSFQVAFDSQYVPISALTANDTYTITIGAGGVSETNGTDTTIIGTGISINALGGGSGGNESGAPLPADGGCGGGGLNDIYLTGGIGYQGGNGGNGDNSEFNIASACGGGGIGGNGNTNDIFIGGTGGLPLTYLGTAYGGGGGGGVSSGGTGGAGGGAGAGAGGRSSGGGASYGVSATANTGSGGGGGGIGGGSGGSGIVILSYAIDGSQTLIQHGSIITGTNNDIQINSSSNIVLNPTLGVSGLIVSNLASVASATPDGFYRLLYNPSTGQIVYGTDLSP